MPNTSTKTKTYMGIADAHGVESLVLKEDSRMPPFVLQLRANANRQRHACYYEVDLNEEELKAISALLKDEKFHLALQFLKNQPSVRLPEDHLHSWEMIPNDKLDPYWSSN